MRKEKAKNYFLGRDGCEKLNCAQAVIKVFADVFNSSSGDVAAFVSCGGGKAPEGRCGALHAARHLVSGNDPAKADLLDQRFHLEAGAIKCSEIRRLRKLSCIGCVERAVDLLEEAIRERSVK